MSETRVTAHGTNALRLGLQATDRIVKDNCERGEPFAANITTLEWYDYTTSIEFAKKPRSAINKVVAVGKILALRDPRCTEMTRFDALWNPKWSRHLIETKVICHYEPFGGRHRPSSLVVAYKYPDGIRIQHIFPLTVYGSLRT